VETFWLIVGIIYLGLAIFYFYLAYRSQRKVTLESLKIDKLPPGTFMPKSSAALEVYSNGVITDVRSAGSKSIIEYSNYLIERVQQHLNKSIFPSIKEYLDETSRINTKGFIVAGVLSLIAAIIAFLVAFLVL